MNSVVTVASLASAGAAPIETAPTVDPIFAAIERHSEAWQIWYQRVHDDVMANSEDEEITELKDLASAAHDVTCMALIETMPTTHAGLAALLTYIEGVNSGALVFTAADDPDPETSAPWNWPVLERHEEYGGEFNEGHSFNMAVLRHATACLRGLS